jgi:signal peptidase II
MQPVEVRESGAPKTTPARLKPILFWGAAAAVLALDQATKGIVRASLEKGESWPDSDWPVRIRYVTNTGAAFGILEDETMFLTVMALLGIAAIYLYYRFPPFDHWVVPIAIGMLLGGAAGNLLDRVRVGEVTDFIDFPRFPAFNVADSSINVGIATIVIGYLLFAPKSRPEPSRPPAIDENTGADG